MAFDCTLLGISTLVFITSTAFIVLIEGSKSATPVPSGDDALVVPGFRVFRYSPLVFLLFTAAGKSAFAGAFWWISYAWQRYMHGSNSFKWSAVTSEASASNGISSPSTQPGARGRVFMIAASEHDVFHPKDFLRLYTISAFLYAINDVLVFVVMSFFDNTNYSVLATGKTVVVAVLTRLVLHRRLTDVQVISLVILTTGVVVNQYDFSECSGGEAPSYMGYLVVVAAEIVGGFAGIMNEWVMKRAPQQSVHFQNLNLYMASVFLYIPLILIWEYPIVFSSDPMRVTSNLGSSHLIAMLFVNIARGISISLVYNYSTNLTKVFIISLCILANAAAGHFILKQNKLTMQFFLSFILVCSALYLYASQKSVLERRTANAKYSSLPVRQLSGIGAHEDDISLDLGASIDDDVDEFATITQEDEDTEMNGDW